MPRTISFVYPLFCLLSFAFAAGGLRADTVARWTFDDYPVGTVLEPGMKFKNKLNPGTYDLVVRAVDPSAALEANRPVVTNGFPEYLKWTPYYGASNTLHETCGTAVWFKGGNAKGYYLELADPDGALKTQNWTLEMFTRSVNFNCDGTLVSMPAMTDGTMYNTNSICYKNPLKTWPQTYFLSQDAELGTYKYANAGWNATDCGNMLRDIWIHTALQCDNGTLYYRRDCAAMYRSATWIQPDPSAPFLFGGTLWSGDFKGCITEMRLTSENLSFNNMARATAEGAPHGTTLLYARYEPEDGNTFFTGELADYYNQNPSSRTHNAVDLVFTNDVQDLYVHSGKGKPPCLVKNESSLVPTNMIYFGEYRSSPINDIQNVTFECFVRIDEVTGADDLNGIVQLGYYAANTDSAQYGLFVTPNGSYATTYVPYNLDNTGQYWGTTVMAPSSVKINDGKWHHLAVTCEVEYDTPQTVLRLYLDHEQVKTVSFRGWMRMYNVAASRKLLEVFYNKGWKGAIDEVRISAGALDPVTEMLWQRSHRGSFIFLR